MATYKNDKTYPQSIDEGVRGRQDYGDVDDLAEAIATYGLLNPITIIEKRTIPDLATFVNQPLHPQKPYLLVAGGRRLAAVRKLKWPTVDVRLLQLEEGEVADERLLQEIELIENLKRKDLTVEEELMMTSRLHNSMVERKGQKISRHTEGHTIKATAKLLSKSPSSVQRDLQLGQILEEFPQLRGVKTKAELEKIVKTLDKTGRTKAAIAKAQARAPKTEKERIERMDAAYVVGNFLEWAVTQPDGIFDWAEVDPPYGVDLVVLRKGDAKAASYEEVKEEDYEEFIRETIQQTYRLLKDGSWSIFWHPTVRQEQFYNLLTEAGFIVDRLPALWIKPTGVTQNPTILMPRAYEQFFYARKGKAEFRSTPPRNWWEGKVLHENHRSHSAERDAMLIFNILKHFVWPGTKGLVPFAGSGNTLLVASDLQAEAIGFDVAKAHKEPYMYKVVKKTGKDPYYLWLAYNRDKL